MSLENTAPPSWAARWAAIAIEKVLTRAGKTYTVDPQIPPEFLIDTIGWRSLQLMRGIARLRSPVFLGRRVRIRVRRGLSIGHLAAIGDGSQIDCSGSRGVILGSGAKLGRYVTVTTTSQMSKRGVGLKIGPNSGVGDYAHIGCSGGVTIGRDVIIGPNCSFHSQEHVTDRTDIPIRAQGTTEDEIVLADDVWVGARVTFLAGAKVGYGSVVAAGAIVRGEFPPHTVIAGVPARAIRSRTATSPKGAGRR